MSISTTSRSRKVLLLATNNEKKRGELQQMVEREFEVRTLKDMQLDDVVFVEEEPSFAGNARVKIDAIVHALQERSLHQDVFAVLADDSGLEVDALQGRPGVRSARFASDHDAGQGDDANNVLLHKMLDDVGDAQRTARYACAICLQLVRADMNFTAFGVVEGRIARVAKGAGGFGYDPYFLPDERPGQHMAELSALDKSFISHRGKATRQVLSALRDAMQRRG